jgi:hypothetical protein
MVAPRVLAVGVVALLLGIQFRAVESFVLNEPTSRFIETRLQKSHDIHNGHYGAYPEFGHHDPWNAGFTMSTPRKSISPPRWLAWSFISLGAVLILSAPRFRT